MKVIFLGTGEAFDENLSNNSSLIISNKTNLLLDCGFTVPHQLWKYNDDQNLLDGIYISHAHADHYFGLPSLFLRMWEEDRKKPITIICQKGLKKKIKDLMELGYKGCSKKFKVKINFIEAKNIVKFKDLKLSFAKTEHSISNFAVRVENNEKSLCYSGDGMFNQRAERLYKDCDLLIHEAYLYNKRIHGHACVVDLIEMAERNNVKILALTHINRFLRRKELSKKKINSHKIKIIIPKPFSKLELDGPKNRKIIVKVIKD